VNVTLIRLATPRGGAATYVAVRSADALMVLARGPAAFAAVAGSHGLDPADFDVDTLPWEDLPGAEAAAARALAADVPRPVLFLGTAVAGRWTRWCLAVPPPRPAPGLRRGRRR
jgi:hypothetical protein